MAFEIAQIGLAIWQGAEAKKAGRAAEKEADEAAEEERRRAVFEGSMATERAHDILVESQRETGALKALGATAGVSGGSFETMKAQIEGRRRRQMTLLNKQVSESMRRSEVSARSFKSQGRRLRKAGERQAWQSYAQAGFDVGLGITAGARDPDFKRKWYSWGQYN